MAASVDSAGGVAWAGPQYSFNLKRASQIPNYCAQLAKMLYTQPSMKMRGREGKVISLSNWADVRIASIVNQNFRNRFKPPFWDIHEFGCGNDQLYNQEGVSMGSGLVLWMDTSRQAMHDDNLKDAIADLECAYGQILSQVAINWVSAGSEFSRQMYGGGDPEEFAVFIKKAEHSLQEEAALIRFMIQRFQASKDVRFDDEWEEGPRRGDLYLWVRKSKLNEVAQRFGFQFRNHEGLEKKKVD